MATTVRGRIHLVASVSIAVVLLLAFQMAARADWQASNNFWIHYQPFLGTLNQGGEDAGVVYDPTYRIVHVEATYLGWTQDAVNQMRNIGACIYNGCSTIKVVAPVFHASVKNSVPGQANALHEFGWGASNLPGWHYVAPHPSLYDEVRFQIEDPNSMQAEPTLYFVQVHYWDSAYYTPYGMYTKTNGQVDLSTYQIDISGLNGSPDYRDYNTKLCINDDVAVETTPSQTCA